MRPFRFQFDGRQTNNLLFSERTHLILPYT